MISTLRDLTYNKQTFLKKVWGSACQVTGTGRDSRDINRDIMRDIMWA